MICDASGSGGTIVDLFASASEVAATMIFGGECTPRPELEPRLLEFCRVLARNQPRSLVTQSRLLIPKSLVCDQVLGVGIVLSTVQNPAGVSDRIRLTIDSFAPFRQDGNEGQAFLLHGA